MSLAHKLIIGNELLFGRVCAPYALTFIERLAALVPRPRVHLITYHGVLASAASWRDLIVPAPPEELSSSQEQRDSEHQHHPSGAGAYRWSELMRRECRENTLTGCLNVASGPCEAIPRSLDHYTVLEEM